MSIKKTKVTIVKSTKKAHLVENESGLQGWVQKRWLKDGMVSIATFEKAVAFIANRTRENDAAKTKDQSYQSVEISRETEKAIAISVDICNAADQVISPLAWFPKSMCKLESGVWSVLGWMIKDRVNKMVDSGCWLDHGSQAYNLMVV